MIKFKLRPAYGSKELLIEFTSGAEKDSFISELKAVLSPLSVSISGGKDLWMNDEKLYQAESVLGSFQISVDTWGLAFILAKENQELIIRIDGLLSKNYKFEKELVDYKDYE